MTKIQKCGMVFFLAATTMLIVVLFLNQYQLNDTLLSKIKKEEPALSLMEFNTSKAYSNKLQFLDHLDKSLKNVNQQIISDFSISEEEKDQLIELSKQEQTVVYSAEVVKEVFGNTDTTSRFKQQQLLERSDWLFNESFNSLDDFSSQLDGVINDINREIPWTLALSNDRIKALKLSITLESGIGLVSKNPILFLWITIGLGLFGAFMYILPRFIRPPGIQNNHIFHNSNTGWGWISYIIGFLLIAFYIVLYWNPEYITEWITIVNPISMAISGTKASQWFFYGLLYTLAILVMGVRMIIKYRHSKYHVIRTCSLMFFQASFAFLIPEILVLLNQPWYDFKNIWPLNYNLFFDYNINHLVNSGALGIFMLVWGIILVIVAVPLFSYFYGKRWYCSWICGCGGLAETLGDPYRQLSDKSLKAWKIERWMVHGVLVFVTLMTAGTLYTYFSGNSNILGIDTFVFRQTYGFMIGAAFSGVVGVGFYPLMGNRIWCRFGCPLAAYIGLVQRFKSRFRITTNGGQCISCGNCSTYCEMGIDVRWYAQRGQNIIRSSCVGCGVCASVCPRGVLKLENDKEEGRFGKPILIGNDSIKVQ